MPDDPIMRPLKIHVCLVVEKTPFEPHRSSTSPPSPPFIPLLSIVFANGDCLLCRISSSRVCEGYITRFSRFFGKKNKSTKLRDSGCVSRLYYREPRNEIRKERKEKGGGERRKRSIGMTSSTFVVRFPFHRGHTPVLLL